MKLNALIKILSVGAGLSAASLFANTAIVTDTPFDGLASPEGAGGGEFSLYTSGNGTFTTFCLENFVHVDFDRKYTYTISDRAYAGGPDAHDPVGAGPAGDPLSKGTVWLYENFIKGTLSGFDASGNATSYNGVNHDLDAGLLQEAIWTLEDEFNYDKKGTNPYLKLVYALYGKTGAYTTVGADSKVKVINLWGPLQKDGTLKDIQSMLIYVPDNGMTAALLGVGLLSIAAFRRKR